MAIRFPNEDGKTEAGDGDSGDRDPEEETGSEDAPSKRKQKRARKAAERDRARQAKAAERDRRRLEKEKRRRERKAEKKAAPKDERKPKADDKPKADEKPKAGRSRTERKPGERKPGERKPGERKRKRGRGSRPKLSAKRAKATLAKAVPSRKKEESSGDEAKPKRAKGERRPAGTLERAFTQVLAIYGAILAGVIGVVSVVVKALAKPVRKLGRRVGVWVAAISRFLTPTRGLLLAALGCALLLGLSQFVDYRGISIGADAYAPGIQTVAPAPEVEREELGSAHSYMMIPVAILAIAALLVAVRTRRWQLCRLVVLLGVLAIAVAIFVDRPAGLDEGDLNETFTGVEAKLLGGYWMQIFAGAGLAVTSFLLAGEIKRDAPARARRKAPKAPKAPRGSEEPEAGKRRRRTRRRAAGAEGAGA